MLIAILILAAVVAALVYYVRKHHVTVKGELTNLKVIASAILEKVHAAEKRAITDVKTDAKKL